MKLLDFKESSCKLLTICGRIESNNKDFLYWLADKNKELIIFKYRTKSGMVYVRIPKERKENHLHIDCALKECFPKGKAPKSTHKKNEIVKLLQGAIGSTFNGIVIGNFILPLERLPEGGLVRTLFSGMKSDDVGVKLTGGKLSVEGAPVDAIRWSIIEKKNKKKVLISVYAKKIDTLDESFLIESQKCMEEQLSLFILGEQNNG